MNRTVAGIMKMYLTDLRASLVVFWSILLAVYAILVFVLLRFGGEVTTGGMSAPYIYLFVAGIVGVKETLSYALGMSVRRTDYLRGVLASGVIVAAAFSTVLCALSALEKTLFDRFDGASLAFFHPGVLDGIGLLGQWLAQLLYFAFAFAAGLLIALLYRRFGAIGLYAAAALVLLAFFLTHLFGGWPIFFRWIVSLDGPLHAALWTLPVSAASAAISFWLIRRVTA